MDEIDLMVVLDAIVTFVKGLQLRASLSIAQALRVKNKDNIIYSMQTQLLFMNFNLDENLITSRLKHQISKEINSEAVLNKTSVKPSTILITITAYRAQSQGEEGATKIIR